MLCNRSYTARLSTADSPQYLIPFVNSPVLRTANKGREQSIAQASLSRFPRSELVRPDGPGCLNLHQSKAHAFWTDTAVLFSHRKPKQRMSGSIFHGPRIWEYHYFVKKIISRWMHLRLVPHHHMTLAEGSRLENSTRAVCFTDVLSCPCSNPSSRVRP
jgi:hypothetical protein